MVGVQVFKLVREPDFPFAKIREYGPTPDFAPDIEISELLNLSDWQQRTFKKPMLDDITGSYQYFPSHNGLSTYVHGVAKNNPVVKLAEESNTEFLERKERQPLHVARTAEIATALFWTAAVIRTSVIEESLANISDGREIREDVARYSADAIADYGYCLVNPVQKDYLGHDSGKELKVVMDRLFPGVSNSILEFGKYADGNFDELRSYNGVALLESTLSEQNRRIAHWQPRHEAVCSVYPEIEISEEILLLKVPLEEMLDIQIRIPDSV